MTECDLSSVVVAHADGSERDQRRELLTPEVVAGRSVGAIEIDVSKRARFTQAVALGRPLIVVNGVCGSLSREVKILHLGKDVFEVLDGGNVLENSVGAIEARATQLIRSFRHLASSSEVVAGALRVVKVDRFCDIKLLEEVATESADVGRIEEEPTGQL